MPRCISSVEVSEAAVYRSIKRWQPSFCIDEFDSVMVDDSKTGLRSVINSGHARGQGVLRCIGDDKVPELFPTFAPKALGMNGRRLPPPTLSRSIFVEQRRRKKSEKIEKFKHQDDNELADLRSRLRRWSLDNADALRNAKPHVPDELANRAEDNWVLLWAIGDLCSGVHDFGDKARLAAIRIEGKADNKTLGERLLADVKALFDADKFAEAIHSVTIVEKLLGDLEKSCLPARQGIDPEPVGAGAQSLRHRHHQQGGTQRLSAVRLRGRMGKVPVMRAVSFRGAFQTVDLSKSLRRRHK
jgi:putative DNA primase/helicase